MTQQKNLVYIGSLQYMQELLQIGLGILPINLYFLKGLYKRVKILTDPV